MDLMASRLSLMIESVHAIFTQMKSGVKDYKWEECAMNGAGSDV